MRCINQKKYVLLLLMLPLGYLLAKETKIGFVDSDRIFKEYQATAAATAEFNEFVSTYRDSASILKQNIEELKAELESQRLVLSEEARLRKLDEIESLNKAYNQFLQNVFGNNGKVDQKNNELMAPILTRVNDAVAKIALQEGFAIVLDLAEGVFYASSEIDVTDLVINELNLEYGPQTLPTGEIKKYVAIMPLREENIEATNADLGQRCQNELYEVIAGFSQRFKIVGKNEVNSEIIKKGYGRNIDDNQAYMIAHSLACDYIITGKVSKFGTKIDYTIALKDVKSRHEVLKKSSSVTDDIKLSETLNNDLRVLIEKIE